MQKWGLPADEFADTNHLPHQLYVREARRLRGEVVLTEHDLRAGALPRDVIALGSYHLDIREVQAQRAIIEHARRVVLVADSSKFARSAPARTSGASALTRCDPSVAT